MSDAEVPSPEEDLLWSLAHTVGRYRENGHEPICVAIGAHAFPGLLSQPVAVRLFEPRPNGGWSFRGVPVHIAPAGTGVSVFTDPVSLEKALARHA